jgi:hypothetical protein
MRANSSSQPPRIFRWLVAYYGVLQVVHLIVLGFGLVHYIRQGTIGYPAPAPPAGWSDQAEAFLLGNGFLDAIISGVALVYVMTYFKKTPWSEFLGIGCLTASLCSGIFFVFGTVVSGAWSAHPVNYTGLTLVFTPMVLLFLLTVRSALRTIPSSLVNGMI